MQKIQYLDCHAAWDGEQLCIGNQCITRIYPVRKGHLSIGELRTADGYVWGNYESKQLLMIGNSVKSDIAPVVNLGGWAINTPHDVVWVHEMMDMPESDRIIVVQNIREIVPFLL